MTPFIERALSERTLGLALHYPFIHAAVVGLGAMRTLEFGAGGSTRVFLEALPPDALHESISMETLAEVASKYIRQPDNPLMLAIDERGRHAFVPRRKPPVGPFWMHLHGESGQHRHPTQAPLDLILHDGSHAADVVAADIAWAWPHLKRHGLLLVHDTQHSYCGAEVRAGLKRGLEAAFARFTATTLPYGFGLTIVRREDGDETISPAVAKATSKHATEPTEESWPTEGAL